MVVAKRRWGRRGGAKEGIVGVGRKEKEGGGGYMAAGPEVCVEGDGEEQVGRDGEEMSGGEQRISGCW